MFKLKYTVFLSVVAGIFMLSSSGGRSNAWSNAPGDNGYCINCHNSGTSGGNITLTGLPTQFEPNQTYSMTVTITDADALRGGFQIVATDGSNNTQIGTFSTPSGTTINNVNRLVQSTPKAFSGGSVSWTFDWTAPATEPGSGNIKFYYAGNAAAGGTGTGGDYGYSGSSSNIALPVELTAFNGKSVNNQIHLEWATASEVNNQGFEVERSSNGDSWENIGFVEGNGSTIEGQVYDFVDENPFSKLTYYRLKQIDFDGAFEYSEIIQIDHKSASNAINIYPSPTVDRLNFDITIASDIQIIDLNGKLVSQLLSKERNSIDVSTLKNGVYFIRFVDGNGLNQIKKFVKN